MICESCGFRYVHERCFNCAPVGGFVTHAAQEARGPHRIEECVIDDPELTEMLRMDWWDEWQDVGGEA